MIGATLYAIYLYLIPILLKAYGVSENYYGIILAVGVLMFGIGGKYSSIIKQKDWFIKKGICLGSSIIFVIAALCNFAISAILLLIVIRLLWGCFDVIYSVELNSKITDSTTRASIISISSAIEGGSASIITILLGVLIENMSISSVLLFMAGIFIVLSITFSFFTQSNYRKGVEYEY